MSHVSAPTALLLRRRSTLEPLVLDPSLLLGVGGEARVFALRGDDRLVAKIYHEPTVERARKVALMIEEPPSIDDPRAKLAWPLDLLLGERGRFAGFLMPRASGPRLFELYNPISRRKSGEPCDHALLHRAGAHVASAFEALHARGYVVGDVNESNVLLGADGGVTLVDTDSFQVRDRDDGTIHRSKVGKAEFTPPELQGRTFADFDRTPEHDRFGLGVLIFLALMEGTHPFAGRMDVKAETPPVEERIRHGLFPHQRHPEINPPKLAPPFTILDPAVRALFVRCFAAGHADPAARPAAAEWREALSDAEGRMETCGANRHHRFAPHLDACPWCERTELLHGRDPFPPDPQPAPRAMVPAPRMAPMPLARPAVAPVAAPVAPLAPVAHPVAPRPAPLRRLSSISSPSSPRHWSPLATIIGIVLFGDVAMDLGWFGILILVSLAIFVWQQVMKDDDGPALPPRPPAPPALASVQATQPGLALRRPPYPQAALQTPRPGPRQMRWAAHTYRLRFGDAHAEHVDDPPWMTNQAELERTLDGCIPPMGVHPADWTMRLAVKVGADGWADPGTVQVVGRNPGGLLVHPVIDAASRTRFRPMTYKGVVVATWVWFDVTFEQP